MKGDRYSSDNPIAAFGTLIAALGGGGDRGQTSTASDAEDFGRGARFVPDEVTVARRRGEEVHFHTSCQASTCCWYWQMPNGGLIYHYDRNDFEKLRDHHQGVCPECGNSA